MRVLVWFRHDLRLADHIPLLQAVKDAAEIIPFYILEDRFHTDTAYGFSRMGGFRRRFLSEALRELRLCLHNCGADLVVREGQAAEAIAQIHRQFPLNAIYTEDQPAPEEMEIYQSVAKLGIPMQTFENSGLLQSGDLPFDRAETPWLFTDFRKEIEKHLVVRKECDAPQRIPFPQGLNSGALPGWDQAAPEITETCSQSGIDYRGGAEPARDRLNRYIWQEDRLAHYKQTRNQMLGANYSSKISAALAHGCISPVQVYWEVRRYEAERISNSSTYWLIFELLWREFFRLTAKKEGGAFFGVKRTREFRWTSEHERWRTGNTGVPLVDACMNELRLTGYLGNRGRQIVASYLINDLRQHWYPAARWFESVLTDYDVYSNYGNWTYLAGVGHDLRRNRYFSIEKQAKHYDPAGLYVSFWKDFRSE